MGSKPKKKAPKLISGRKAAVKKAMKKAAETATLRNLAGCFRKLLRAKCDSGAKVEKSVAKKKAPAKKKKAAKKKPAKKKAAKAKKAKAKVKKASKAVKKAKKALKKAAKKA